MTMGERIGVILSERHIKQVDFAKTLGISANYVNLLVNDKKTNISATLAKLIEETYGYSSRWLIDGIGDKIVENGISASKAEILKKIQKMSDTDVKATLAFVKTLESVNNDYADDKTESNE